MRRSSLTLLLVLSLVLAGCNSLALGDDETPEQTLTPAPVPTDRPTSTPVPQLAPGLKSVGVTDVFALAEAHVTVLDGTSYAVHENFTTQYINGTIYRRFTVHMQVVADDSRFYRVQNRSGVAVRGSGSVSIWSNGERVFVAQMTKNSTTYSVPQGANGKPVPPRVALDVLAVASSGEIVTLFGSVETRVVDSTIRNGTTLYRVVATNVTNPFAFETANWRNPRNVTFRALVSSRGLVSEYHLNYTATLNNSTVHVSRHVRYTDIGNTTVECPPWYDEVIENVTGTNDTTRSES